MMQLKSTYLVTCDACRESTAEFSTYKTYSDFCTKPSGEDVPVGWEIRYDRNDYCGEIVCPQCLPRFKDLK